MSTIKINLPGIGEVEMIMTDEQIKKAIIQSKKILNEPTNTADYIYEGGKATKPTPGGFTNNKIDWDSYFPKVSLDEIKNLSEEALSYENNIRIAAIAACTVLTIALNAYMKSGSLGGGTTKPTDPEIPIELPEEPIVE